MSAQGSEPSRVDLARIALRRARDKAKSAPSRGPDGRRSPPEVQVSSTNGRDPAPLGGVIQRLLVDHAWQRAAAGGVLLDQWPAIVGAQRAAHWEAIGYDATTGTLTVGCTSDAWATTLRLLEREVIAQIAQRLPSTRLLRISVRRSDQSGFRR
ncbi:DciA family protein [Streptomyces sp. NPDC051572]|uniref:DciA family protein n=1 Tax=Streptomyces sp. NPDC051572 TaxID=3155802 RepID=UPI00344D10C6